MRENPPKNPLFWQKPPILGIFLILANFGDFRYFEESPRFWQVLKNDHLDDFQQCRRRDQSRGHVCESTHTLQGRALELYSEWRSLAGADNFYIPSLWRWYSGLSCTSRCMKGTGVYDCVLFEREWLFII